MSTEVQTPRQITYPTRDRAAQQQWMAPVVMHDETIGGNGGHGIWWEGTSHCEIERVTIMGERQVGICLVWAMFANIRNVKVNGPHEGFCVRSGQGVWPDGKHSNSSSNLPRFIDCVFFGQDEQSVGFIVDGAANQIFEHCCVQGRKCKTGWWIYPRNRNSLTELVRCWVEVPDGIHTAIEFDSVESGLVLRGLRFSNQHPPEVLIDMSGADSCRLTVEQCQWEQIPKMRLHKSTEVKLGFGNAFSHDDFFQAVEWTGV